MLSSFVSTEDNATPGGRETQPLPAIVLGGVGVLVFSVSLPATRVAVDLGLDPWFVAFGRAVGAAVLAAVYLALVRARAPTGAELRRLVLVAGGVVVAFPLATSVALQGATATHAIVVVAVLPALTACIAVARAGERPAAAFWVASVAGSGAVVGFVLVSAGGGLGTTDAVLLAGNLACAVGYAEGGALARSLGGTRTIAWALLLAAPATVPVAVLTAPADGVPAEAWLAFAYLSGFSMFLGFVAWYAGLARGGIARVGQVQLAQPLLSLAWAGVLVGERVPASALAVAAVVLTCVAAAQRARVDGAPPSRTPSARPWGHRRPRAAVRAATGGRLPP